MIDLSQISQLTLDGRKVVKLAVNGRKVWSESGAAWFTMKNVGTGDQTVRMSNVGDNVEYSSDGGSTWTAYVNASDITVGEESEVMFRHNGISAWTSSLINVQGSTGLWKVSGNIMTLLDKTGEMTEFTTNSIFQSMFYRVGVTDASELELPATTLKNACYYNMFSGCSSLTAAPALPAMTLVASCYASMFSGCSSLSAAPELPATTLLSSCYYGMFEGCTSLTSAPSLPASALASYCYQSMFRDCTSLSAFPKIGAVSAAQGQNRSLDSMFRNCTSLREATLSAADYGLSGLQNIFNGCSGLSSIRCGLTAWNGTTNWVSGVASTGNFYCPPELGVDETIQRGESYCPTEWTVQRFIDYVPYVNVYGAKLDTGFAPTSTMSFRTVISTGLESNDTGVIGNGVNSSDTSRLFYVGDWGWMYDIGRYRARVNISRPNPGVFDISCWNLGIDLSASDGTTMRDAHSAATGAVFPQATLSVNAMTPGSSRNFNISCLQIYDDGMLARDFWAACDQNGTACMWDTVSQQYFYPVASPYYPAAEWTVVE